MPSGPEQAAAEARKAKGLPEPDGSSLVTSIATKIILKEINMGIIGKFAALFSEKYTKMLSTLFGGVIGFVVGQFFAFLVEKGLGTCAMIANENVCTVSLGSYHWSSAEVTLWITGIVMAWISTHAAASAPANKPS